jgi:RND family efflux transporter MFP subunit
MEVEEKPKNETAVVLPQPPSRSTGAWRTVLIVLLLGGAALTYVVISGLDSRVKADTVLRHETEELAIPTVAVIHPKLGAQVSEIALPGNTQAFIDTPIYARASGYLKKWYFDIGAHVKAGDLLAEIETPEIDRQLQQAKSDLSTAQANLDLSETTAKRYQFLLKSDSVSQQDVDNTTGDLAAKKATRDGMASNVRRLEEIVSFQKVYAPFDGVLTARNTDVGALIDAGANTPGKELFHESSTSTLRVYVNVPQVYSTAARVGTTEDLTLQEFPGRTFKGTLVRTADSIDPASRTLLVEVDVKNPTGELLPGAYVTVHVRLPGKSSALTIPANALLFRSEGLQVAVVTNNRTELKKVVMGRDFGNDVEIVSGVGPEDQVIVNPSDSISSGQQVQISGGKQS